MASVLFVSGATAWSSALCYAQQIAFDTASNPVYDDGWQGEVTNLSPPVGPGDNGGFGFTPWNFNNDIYDTPVIGIRSMDGPPTAADPMRTQSQFNQVGTAWRIGLEYNETGVEGWKDIVHLGRGLASPLQVGQTISIVVDPPAENIFFDIETIRFNTGGANICPGCTGAAESRFAWSFFNWLDQDNWGRWTASFSGDAGDYEQDKTALFAVDKAPFEHPEFPMGAAGTDMGLRIDFTLTGAETFDLTATPLDNPAAAFTGSGILLNPGAGPIDWIEFMHYGRPTPDPPDPNAFDTDFFIRSLEVTGSGTVASADFDADGDIDGADFLRWQRGLGATGGAATLANGNADGDADVDAADLVIWKQQFGPGSPAAVNGSAIPEPSAWALVAGAAAGLAGRAVRRGKQSRRSGAAQ